MFTSPSVRVKRRQAAALRTSAIPQSDAVENNSGLKRVVHQHSTEIQIPAQQHSQQAGIESKKSSSLQPSPRKKQAIESTRSDWPSSFAKQPASESTTKEHAHGSTRQSIPWQLSGKENEAAIPANDVANLKAKYSSKISLSPSTSDVAVVSRNDAFRPGGRIEESDNAMHTLLQGDKHAVFEIAGFPEQVRKQLGSIDLRNVPLTVGLNAESKFAFVATPTTCFVWSYVYNRTSMNSVYRLAMPDPDSAAIYEAPVVALVAASEKQSDVGLLACSATGQIRYWDRVVFGLGGTERFFNKDLAISDSTDRCCQIIEIYSGLFVIATSKGHLYQVSLQNTQGAIELDTRLLSKNSGTKIGMLSRVSSLLGGSAYSSGTAAAATVGAGDALVGLARGGRTEIRHSCELLVLTRERLLKWVVSRTQPEIFMYSMDISHSLGDLVAQKVGADAEIIIFDVAATRSNDICLLIGLQLPQRPEELQMGISVFRSSQVSTEPEVLGLWLLNHVWAEPLSQEGMERPRLVLPEGGPAMYVVSRKTVITSIIPTSGIAFEEAIFFRDDDFILGFSTVSRPPHHLSQEQSESSLVLSCLNAGLLRVTTNTGRVFSIAASVDSELDVANTGDTDNEPHMASGWPSSGTLVSRPSSIDNIERGFKNQIEQAVFFGMDNSYNPISFAITSQASGVDSSLESAALRVSKSIVNNTSHFIADRLDLGAHLKERLRRAHSVMQFVAGNDLADKISYSARVQLCANTEKLAAASALWEYQNDIWAKKHSAASQLMANLISSFLESIGLQSKDPLRVFFKQHVAAIGDMLVYMHRNLAALRRALEDSESGMRDSQLVAYEANRIIIATLQSAFGYRFQNGQLYGIDSDSDTSFSDTTPTKPTQAENWTEHTSIVELLLERLEESYRLCRDISGRNCASIYERIKSTSLPGDEHTSENEQKLSVFDNEISISHTNISSSSAAISDGAKNDSDLRKRLDTDDPYVSSLALLYSTINQMGPLANLCFRVLVDRVTFLHGAHPNDANRLARRYDMMRSRYLLCLVPLGRAPIAFRLAEEYRDLASLIVLVFTTDRENAAEHLRNYVHRFGKEFADALLVYYERRQAWASLLYAQDEHFDVWLKEFIDKRTVSGSHGPMSQIGWIHDIKMNDFGAAATKLARAGRGSDEVDQARTMLSLSKLAFVVVESNDTIQDEAIAKAHTRLEDALEMCEVQDNLMQYFTALIRASKNHSREQLWRRRDDINDRKASLDVAMLTTTPECRHNFPALYTVYGELIRRVWNGRTLSAEDLLDVLTFPDNTQQINAETETASGESTEQFNEILRERGSLAVDILSRASFNLPEQTREAALRTIWRRVFLSDDWCAIARRLGSNIPDNVLRSELSNTLLYTMLKSCYLMRELAHPDWYLLPTDAFASCDLEYLVETRLGPQFAQKHLEPAQWRPLSTTTSTALTKDYNEEDRRLRAAIDSGLNGYYTEILRIVADENNLHKTDLTTFGKDEHEYEEHSDTISIASDNVDDGSDDDVAMDSD
ncbi:hypothetical protein GGI25_000906 [Coemansia spiralis]|uniref:Uncharacterized protein n=2 Tax=Coemansia TaxID=4863 RepID=A0A9W8GDK8_9FUNG|nr:hypothetical protein EDC05_001924 [Coemansia umbellata]KAJ2623140.1 hypothetical protein GGI26_002554 [Coemansia sp. RSA 1358]KAJ2680018.1 hypothetical protein GGI25_000906 [Coemansia spiralis]